jgi:hypothetical protein
MIAIGIGTVLLGMATVSVNVMLQTNLSTKNYGIASPLAQELMDNVTSVVEARWSNIYNLSPKGTTASYYFVASGTGLKVTSGSEIIIKEGVSYTRNFFVENVSRDGSNNIVSSGGADDPSTQKLTFVVWWSVGASTSSVKLVKYVTRWKNFSASQSDWSGGSGADGPILVDSIGNRFANASSQIDFSSVPGSIKLNLSP